MSSPGGTQRGSPLALGAARTVAAAQWGAIERGQLLSLGVSRAAVGRWLSSGRLLPEHRGVYGWERPIDTYRGRCMAAVLATGDRALTAGIPALALWDVVDLRPLPVVVATTAHRRSRGDIVVRRLRTLHPADRATRHGVPVLSLPRALLDAVGDLRPQQLERAVQEAEYRRSLNWEAMTETVARCPGRHVAEVLKLGLPQPPTESELEVAMEEILDRLVRYERQVPVPALGIRMDFYLPDHRVNVEVDGYAGHGGRKRFEDDRRRDQLLWAEHRIPVLRFTWVQVIRRPGEVTETLEAALS